jgi:hypothetical protein
MKDSKNFLFTLNISLWKLDSGVMFFMSLTSIENNFILNKGKNLMKWSIKTCEACIQISPILGVTIFSHKCSLSHA